MKRFIGLTFLFMAWGFYELSGGADFRAPAPPVSLASVTPTHTAPSPAEPRQTVRTTTARTGAVARPTPVIATLRPQPAKLIRDLPAPLPETIRLNRARARLGQGMALYAGAGIGQPLQLAALGARAPTDPQAEPQAQVTPMRQADIRSISGTRVNMRQGPGTTYPVMARMQLGDKVEVLSDPGNGWLRLRDMSDMRIGWIAKSLVEPGG